MSASFSSFSAAASPHTPRHVHSWTSSPLKARPPQSPTTPTSSLLGSPMNVTFRDPLAMQRVNSTPQSPRITRGYPIGDAATPAKRMSPAQYDGECASPLTPRRRTPAQQPQPKVVSAQTESMHSVGPTTPRTAFKTGSPMRPNPGVYSSTQPLQPVLHSKQSQQPPALHLEDLSSTASSMDMSRETASVGEARGAWHPPQQQQPTSPRVGAKGVSHTVVYGSGSYTAQRYNSPTASRRVHNVTGSPMATRSAAQFSTPTKLVKSPSSYSFNSSPVQQGRSPMNTPRAIEDMLRSIYTDTASSPTTPPRHATGTPTTPRGAGASSASSAAVASIHQRMNSFHVDLNTTAWSPHKASAPTPQTTQQKPSSVTTSTVGVDARCAEFKTLKQFSTAWAPKYHENQRAYCMGGYAPLDRGQTLHNRYYVLKKLGYGEFSTVWLAHDMKATSPQHTFVAVKVSKADQRVINGTKYELNLLSYLGSAKSSIRASMTHLLHAFEFQSVHGKHLCMVQPLHGSNLLCVIDQLKAKRRSRTVSEVNMVKKITLDILKALAQLEEVNVIHTDLKPENVLCSAPDAGIMRAIQEYVRTLPPGTVSASTMSQVESGSPDCIVTLADFGLSYLLEPANTTNKAAQKVGSRSLYVPHAGHATNHGTLIQTREYRAPEILLGCDFNARTDIWSVGCMVYELLTGEFLMDPKRKASREPEMDVEHLCNMMQIIGSVPSSILKKKGAHFDKFFTASGVFRYSDRLRNNKRRALDVELMSVLSPSEAQAAAEFILSCFTYDPTERMHAKDLMNTPWIRSLDADSEVSL